MSDKEHEIPVKVVDRRWWANTDESGAPREDARGTGKPSYVEALEQQIADKDKQIADLLAKYRGAEKEFEDARLRLRREISKDIERSRRDILADLLEVVDNLDRAIESAHQGTSTEVILQGVEMVRRHFLAKLDGFGVKRIESDRQRFDPTLHEAISTLPATSPDEDGLVVGTVRSGYRIGEDVLRPAAVAVAKAT